MSEEFPPESGSCIVEVRHNLKFGTYAVSKCQLKAGDIICEEWPIMIGPRPGKLDSRNLGLVCLTCYRACDKDKCPVCKWPVCDGICQKGVLHAKNECRILSENKVRPENPVLEPMAIRTLRCLLLKDNDPAKWELLMRHDAQLDNRRRDPSTVESTAFVIHFLLNKCQMPFDPITVERVMGVLAINEFCLTTDYSRNALLIFHNVSFFAHSCAPNMETIWKFHPTQDSTYAPSYFSIKFYAGRDIAAGEILTHSYILYSSSVKARHNALSNYYFYCDCDKCRRDLFNEIPADLNMNIESEKEYICPAG